MADEESILDPEIERLSERLGKDPDSLVFAPLADAYRRSGLIEEAIDVLRKGMEKHPNYASAFIVLGRCYQDQKMYELARSEFEKALDVDRDNFLASKLYAAVLIPLGRKEEAMERYKRLLESDPANVEIQNAIEDLSHMQETEEEKKDLGSGADESMFGFGDIGTEEPSGGAPGFGDMFGGAEPDAGESTEVVPPPADAPVPEEEAPGLGGRSPFDFGTIPESASAEPEKPKEEETPPAFLEPTVIKTNGSTTRTHDLGGGNEYAGVELTKPGVAEEKEEIVLPKPTGKTAFAAPPGLDASIGSKIDADLAEIYFDHGFTDKAIRTYERLLESEPDREEYKSRLGELRGAPAPAEEVADARPDVFPSEILEPFSDTAPERPAAPADDAGEFSEAATPEGDQTISLSDLFAGGGAPPGGSPESPPPPREPEREEEKNPGEKGQTKGGFESFQSWLDGLGN